MRHISRKSILLGAVVASLAFAGFALSAGVSVSLSPTGPTPTVVTVGYGDTVTFVNGDSVAHGITSSRPELNAPIIPAGQTFTTVLTGRTATYPYRQTGTGRSIAGAIVSHVDGTVSLKSSAHTVNYGGTVKLSGVSSMFGAPVSIQRRLSGERGWAEIASLPSGTDGSYASSVKPTKGAKYRATIAGNQIFSQLQLVAVSPTLSIKSQAKRAMVNHKVTITSRLNPGSAATQITLNVCNTSKGRWERAQSKRPNGSGSVTFKWTAVRGQNYLRTSVVHHDANTGYLAPTSAKVSVVGVGKAPKVVGKKHKPAAKPKSCS